MAPNNIDTRRRFYFQIAIACIIALALLVSPMPVLARSDAAMRDNPAWVDNPFEGDNPGGRESLHQEASSSAQNPVEATLPDYKSFVLSVQNGERGVLRGVYVPDVLALPIIQQPVSNPGFVSRNDNEITQFNMAAEVGNIGLLAHNDLSGAVFANIAQGQEVRLIYGDGNVEYFIVDQILKYQALQPYSPNSQFRDLETNITISAEELFRMVYRGERHVTFQTCIEANGLGSWGRLFIIAKPQLFPHVEHQFIQDNLLPFLY